MSINELLKTFDEEKEIVFDGTKYVEKSSAGISLKGVLQRGRIKRIRDATPSRQGVGFTPSSITYNYCRRLKIGQLAGLIDVYYEKKRPAEQTILDAGNMWHELIQKYFWDIGQLKGTYECLKCDKLYHDLVSPEVCPSGIKTHKRKHLRYKEVIMKNDNYLIRGRCDGIIIIDGEEHLIDIKSIQNRTVKTQEAQFCYEDLEHYGPKQTHIAQIILYMWTSGIHRGHLLYVARNSGQYKTYDIPYDESLIKPYLDEINKLIYQSVLLKSGAHIDLPAPCGRKDCPCEEILGKLPSVGGE